MTSEPAEDTSTRWTQCPPGEISGMVHSLKRKARLKRGRQVGALGALLVVSGIALWLWTPPVNQPLVPQAAVPRQRPGQPNYGGIVCSSVIEQAKPFLAGSLDEVTSARIRNHLARCPHCRDEIERIRREMKMSTATAEPGTAGSGQRFDVASALAAY